MKTFSVMSTMKALSMSAAIFAFMVSAFAGVIVAQPGTPKSQRNITPTFHQGNFVSTNPAVPNQQCYDWANRGWITDPGVEMIGGKLDPPLGFLDGFLTTSISANGKYLNWVAEDATVLGFVIKGGPNFNFYKYQGTGFNWDNGLGSPSFPRNGQYPQISHYEFCYVVNEPPVGDQGCTPGYWRNHADRWVGLAPGDLFDTVFGVNYLPGVNVGQAVSTPQSYGAFAFHAVAALLNANASLLAPDHVNYVAYPYSPAQVISEVQAQIATGSPSQTNLATANELGCPLGGTPACSPANPAACLPGVRGASLRSTSTTKDETKNF